MISPSINQYNIVVSAKVTTELGRGDDATAPTPKDNDLPSPVSHSNSSFGFRVLSFS